MDGKWQFINTKQCNAWMENNKLKTEKQCNAMKKNDKLHVLIQKQCNTMKQNDELLLW